MPPSIASPTRILLEPNDPALHQSHLRHRGPTTAEQAKIPCRTNVGTLPDVRRFTAREFSKIRFSPPAAMDELCAWTRSTSPVHTITP